MFKANSQFGIILGNFRSPLVELATVASMTYQVKYKLLNMSWYYEILNLPPKHHLESEGRLTDVV